jgi:hypothetical protein
VYSDFDDLTVSIAASTSRRETLRRLFLAAVGTLGIVGISDADAKSGKHDHKDRQAQAAKKKHKHKNKKKKKKKKHKGGSPTVPPTSPSPPPPPQTGGSCTPNANACAGRACGTVDNGCGVQVSCGDCAGNEVCSPNGQCNCQPNADSCNGRVCGSVDDGCGNQVSCGSDCSGNDVCNADGQCVCAPNQDPCGVRECGTVDDGCGNPVACGSGCTGNDVCNANGECICTPNQNPCGDRVCGTVDDGCGNQVTCGNDGGSCPDASECNAAGVCGADGHCSYAIPDSMIGASCAGGTGVCVKTELDGDTTDGSGTCVISTPSAGICSGADPCSAPPSDGYCGPSGTSDTTCGCYSTETGAGLCLRRDSSFHYPESAIGCHDNDSHPSCDVSSDCLPGRVCVPLNRSDPGANGICCPNRDSDGKAGFCVHVARDLCGVPA